MVKDQDDDLDLEDEDHLNGLDRETRAPETPPTESEPLGDQFERLSEGSLKVIGKVAAFGMGLFFTITH